MRSSPNAQVETFRAKFVRHGAPAAGEAPNTFKGMASVYNTPIDAYIRTRILPGAFARTLRDQQAVSRVKILYQHREDMPIGVPTRLTDSSLGLEIEGKISETSTGKDAIILLNDGVIDELSIGFTPARFEMVLDAETKEMERHISDLDLYEVSLVTFAANRDAKIMSVHSRDLESPDADPYIILAHTPALLARFVEIHKGRVLSAKNKTLVQDSVTALQAGIGALNALLAAAKTDDDADETEAARIARETAARVKAADLLQSVRELELQAIEASF